MDTQSKQLVKNAPAGVEIPSLLFFIGLAGVGKTFAGEVVASRLGYHCYEPEEDLTPAMKLAIEELRSFTDEMRDEYFGIICRRITELRAKHPKLLVTQAAYKERHRAMVRAAHPDVCFVWVTAPERTIAERLIARGGGGVSAELAAVAARNFEPPEDCKVLLNDDCDPAELFNRFLALFQQPS